MQPNSGYRVGNVYGGSPVQVGQGPKINNKRTSFPIRIGRFDLGVGGLVSLAAVLLVGGGGTAAAVSRASGPSAAVRNAAGTWQLPAPKRIGSTTVRSLTLNITPGAVYQATVQSKSGDDSLTMPCSGEVTARG